MAIKQESDLADDQKRLWERSRSAFDAANYDYVINLLQTLLKSVPEFLEGRRRLRVAEIQKYKGLSALSRQMLKVKTEPMAMKASAHMKKTPQDAMIMAEEILALDPFHAKANTILADAAATLELFEISAMAHETIREGKPNDKENLHKLAQFYFKLNDGQKAVKTYEQLLAINPKDGDALSGLKNATALHASKSGGWETAKDYRDILKSKEESSQLEQDARTVRSDEAIHEQIQHLNQQVAAEPNNSVYPRQIGDFYIQLAEQTGEYEEYLTAARQWLEHAWTVGSKADNSLEKRIGQLSIKILDKRIEALRPIAAADPAQAEALRALEIERGRINLDTVRALVEKYPNDGDYRFQFGEALFQVGEYKAAMVELQGALKTPNVRLRAQLLIGRCHGELRMYDLAIKTYKTAAAETSSMDGVKKEIIYNLGQIYEKTGDTKSAVECYKQIYEVDMSYRDVAAKVEASYGDG